MEKLMNYAKNNRYLAAQNSDNNDTNFIYIVVEGFLLFALTDPLTHLFDIRLFLDAEKETCCRRRYVRESKNHLDVNGEEINESFKLWFDDLVWKHYLEHKDRQKQAAHQSIHERDYTNSNYAQIDAIVDDKIAKIIYENINK
ncbi:unnamed protein product [Didymodactylos carnosus]|nr:unnamed protein product [Didymodactylos carnosus]CAF4486878.1 unnamed protein product [Didymodactylos carnosus]